MTRRENFIQQIDRDADEIRTELINKSTQKRNNARAMEEYSPSLLTLDKPAQREKIGPTKFSIPKVVPQEAEQRKSRF